MNFLIDKIGTSNYPWWSNNKMICIYERGYFKTWQRGGSANIQKYFLVFVLNTNPRSCKSIWGPWTRCEHLEVKIKRFSSSFGVLNLTKWRKCAKSSPSGRPSEVGIRREKSPSYSVLTPRMWLTHCWDTKLLSVYAHDHVECFTYPQHVLTMRRSHSNGMWRRR